LSIITDYGRKGGTYVQNTAPPSDSEAGDTWIDSDDKNAYFHDGEFYVKVLEYESEILDE